MLEATDTVHCAATRIVEPKPSLHGLHSTSGMVFSATKMLAAYPLSPIIKSHSEVLSLDWTCLSRTVYRCSVWDIRDLEARAHCACESLLETSWRVHLVCSNTQVSGTWWRINLIDGRIRIFWLVIAQSSTLPVHTCRWESMSREMNLFIYFFLG